MNILDEAEIKSHLRKMYNDIGFEGCLTVLEENVIFQTILLDVIMEEQYREFKEKNNNGKA